MIGKEQMYQMSIKGDRSNPVNYRPVSLTSNDCKIMERIMKKIKDDIVQFLESNQFIGNSQHRFRKRDQV